VTVSSEANLKTTYRSLPYRKRVATLTSLYLYGFVVTAVVLMPAFWMFGWSVTVAVGIAWLVGAMFMLLSWGLLL
jgi:hypothetical protein